MPAATIGSAAFAIVDGVPRVLTIGTGASQWGIGSEPGSIGIGGHYVQPVLLSTCERCETIQVGESARTTGATQTLTVLLFSAAPRAQAKFSLENATAIVQSGGGIALTKGHFAEGVHAGVYPMGFGASAGVLARTAYEAEGPTIGWFWPRLPGSLELSEYDCTQNGSACVPPDELGMHFLRSVEPTEWEFGANAEIQPGETPYYVLGVAELEQGMVS